MEFHPTPFSTSPLAVGSLMRVEPTGFTGFSTSSNLRQGMGDVWPSRGDGLHISSTLDTDTFSDKVFERIHRAINAVSDVSGRHSVVQWRSLVDATKPEESAMRVNAALSKMPLDNKDVFLAIAACITTPAHLAIVAQLNEPFRKEVRDIVLQENMEQLDVAGEDPAEMLVEMARLNLVRLGGVVAVVETFLERPACRRAGLAVLGRILDHQRTNERFLASVLNNKSIILQLFNMRQQPEFEYDVIAITQLLSVGQPQHTALREGPLLGYAVPTTRIQYFGVRDELLSAHLDGTVALWGPPDSVRGTLDMPNDSIPWAMAGSRQGSYLVLAGKPPSPDSTYGNHLLERRKLLRAELAPKPRNPVLHILAYDDANQIWTPGETIQRPLTATLTAVAVLPSGIVCSAESMHVEVAGGRQHDIALFSAATGQSIRTLSQAHSDFVTVLSTCADSTGTLFSGSRDKTVKLFDARSKQPNVATLKTASVFQLPGVHTDTISSISIHDNNIFTTSLDGSLLMWDRRQISTPLASKLFASPILSAAVLGGTAAPLMATATARGLYLVSLPTMVTMDVIPNRAFTQVVGNADSSAIFAADTCGIQVYSVHK